MDKFADKENFSLQLPNIAKGWEKPLQKNNWLTQYCYPHNNINDYQADNIQTLMLLLSKIDKTYVSIKHNTYISKNYNPKTQTLFIENLDCSNLSISNKDLNSLQIIRHISGSVNLSNNSKITKLDGFKNIRSISGNLIIHNTNIKELGGLNQIKNIGSLTISNNRVLEQINGFTYLNEIKHSLVIKDNPLLIQINGLNSLQQIKRGNLEISNNSKLARINGLSNIAEIGKSLILKKCLNLVSIRFLSSLKYAFNLIFNNTSITNADPLRNFFAKNKSIKGSFRMTSCKLTSISFMQGLTQVGSLFYLHDNQLANLQGLESIQSIGASFTLSSNQLDDISQLSQLTYINGMLLLNNNQLHSLTGLENLRFVKTVKLNKQPKTISLYNNNNLNDISALKNIQGYQKKIFFQIDVKQKFKHIPELFSVFFQNHVLTLNADYSSIINFPLIEDQQNLNILKQCENYSIDKIYEKHSHNSEILLKDRKNNHSYILKTNQAFHNIRRYELELSCLALLNQSPQLIQKPQVMKLQSVNASVNSLYYLSKHNDSTDLCDYISKHGPLSETQAIQLIEDMADLLKIMQQLNIVHKNIWPGNIYYNGRFFSLIDFEISSLKGVRQTQEIGSNHDYTSPEAYYGKCSYSSDIYALGCSLYYAVSKQGIKPMYNLKGSSVEEKIYAHLYQPPKFNQYFSKKLQFLILRMLEKESGKRITADELKQLVKTNYNPNKHLINQPHHPKKISGRVLICKALANNQVPFAENLLGKKYLQGTGLKQDSKKAQYWFHKAAKQGWAEAQYNLCLILIEEDIHKYIDDILYWIKEMASHDYHQGQYLQAKLLEHGYIPNQENDQETIISCYQKATEKGNRKAYKRLLELGREIIIKGVQWGTNSKILTQLQRIKPQKRLDNDYLSTLLNLNKYPLINYQRDLYNQTLQSVRKKIFNTSHNKNAELNNSCDYLNLKRIIQNQIDEHKNSIPLHFCDLGCGQLNWIKNIDFKEHLYFGVDIATNNIFENSTQYSNRNFSFRIADIVLDPIAPADYIICVDVLNYLTLEDAIKVINNIIHSGSRYLIASYEKGNNKNDFGQTGEFNSLNFDITPFNFPQPLQRISDDTGDYAIWDIHKLVKIDNLLPSYVSEIKSREIYQQMSRRNSIPGRKDVHECKFIITDVDNDLPQLYFLNTQRQPSHRLFCNRILGGYISPSVFNAISYSNIGRKNLVGSIIAYDSYPINDKDRGIYCINFWPTDPVSFDFIKLAWDLILNNMIYAKDKIFYHMASQTQEQAVQDEEEAYAASTVKTIDSENLFNNLPFLPLNLGESYGILRFLTAQSVVSVKDIVLFNVIPNELSHVSGIISNIPQTPLSHINLIAKQNKIPNAYIKNAAINPSLLALKDQYIHYKVTSDGYSIKKANKNDVDNYFESSRPKYSQNPNRNLDVKAIADLKKLDFADSFAYGTKASNVAELAKILPKNHVPSGFAIPFYFYDEFMKYNGFYEVINDLINEKQFKEVTEYQNKILKQIRKKIKKAKVPAFLVEALNKMHHSFSNNTHLRLRSSTNNEDLIDFNGAGLYDSFTHKDNNKSITSTVKKVWASLWTYRAFIEREFYKVNHLKVVMGILVHPNFKKELANGVAVTKNIYNDTRRGFYVNVQVGEALVTNPTAQTIPEEFIISAAASGQKGYETQYIRRSNLLTSDELILKPDVIAELTQNMEKIHHHFSNRYKIKNAKQFAMDIEFKLSADNVLVIKQARPWI
jgi:pyruvate, water dikinase